MCRVKGKVCGGGEDVEMVDGPENLKIHKKAVRWEGILVLLEATSDG